MAWYVPVAIIAALAAIVALWRLLRAKPPALPTPHEKLPPAARGAVEQAAAAVDRAKREREIVEQRSREEQAARLAKEEAARQRASEEAAGVADAERRAADLRKAADSAATEEERRAAREAAEVASAEASRRRKEQGEAEKRAAYEAKKADDAEGRARRRAEEEARKVEELEVAKHKAEEEASVAALKLRKIEAESGRTLAEGLQKTRGGFMARLAKLVGASSELNDSFLADLEEILFTADIGVRTATALLESVRDRLKRKELSDPTKVKAALREEIEKILTLGGTYRMGGMPEAKSKPQVIMIVGVNGSGKTTTIGKLAFKERVAGRNVLLGAGDTFRAAAAEQLDVWAARAQVDMVKGAADSDPAAVCFDAVKKSVEEGRDLCILDTAGRLHTQAPLMDELKKAKRVIDKALPGAPHEVWLVVDGTMGQNALAQARQFHEALGLTGLVLTKLDGTAKGGVVIGICDETKVPIRYVGVGEKIGDLRPFSPAEFADALFASPRTGRGGVVVQRILLWDIDGTLVSGRGAGLRALSNAVKPNISVTGALGRMRLNGMTDRKIARILCGAQRHHSQPEIAIEEHELAVTADEIDTLLGNYLSALQALTAAEGPAFRLQPGVIEVLDALGPDRAVHGLGTGNIELGAQAKLEPIGLWARFPFGGFGSDAEERADVLRAGHRKAEKHLGRVISPAEVVVIGDTPRDVAAAHDAGFACVGVATGGHSVDELIACGADLVLASLAEPHAADRIVIVGR